MALGKQNTNQLKRARQSQGEQNDDQKRPRRSERISSQHNEPGTRAAKIKNSQLPSPVTHEDSILSDSAKDGPVTPSKDNLRETKERSPVTSPSKTGLSSPPTDTQPFSQLRDPAHIFSHEVEDETKEGVWGYLIPLDQRHGDTLVLRTRSACPRPQDLSKCDTNQNEHEKKQLEKGEEKYEKTKIKGAAAGGYLIGRHPECDCVLKVPTVSNRHCLIFHEIKGGDSVAMLEDLSGNGTFVNRSYVGRNKRRELHEGDEVSILDEARFVFRYPKSRNNHGFKQQYSIQQQLGKGHFATVYLCVEKASGIKYAVKKFEKKGEAGEKSKIDGLEQEIAVLMGVSHPNVLCLKDTFDERDGVYLVLELAPEGELFNWIVMKTKLSEADTRKVFVQLFQGLKYLHERNIVHRDIKPENILLVDRNLSVKLADFGLAKIIGEESFTTTLCGTPSYVAPEILESSSHRRYTRAVDIWSLGVVLYICLCGFPPFSDELYSPENPYTLSQQIKMARFDYPSPYWDPVSDMALDLIDRMLTLDVERRITIGECLQHPWTTQRVLDASDSTEGLTGAMGQLDFSRRKPARERTLLSSLNEVKVAQEVDIDPDVPPLKVFQKNGGEKFKAKDPEKKSKSTKVDKDEKKREPGPASEREPNEFMQLGGAGDQALFEDTSESRYGPDQVSES